MVIWKATTIAALIAMGAVVLTFVVPCFWNAIGVGATGQTRAKNTANAATTITVLVTGDSMHYILILFLIGRVK